MNFVVAITSFYVADLMQQSEILSISKKLSLYLKENCHGELFALINNAGCVRSWYTTTEEGYEQQFALNYLAVFMLTYKLMPFIQKAKGRVIITGSESHKGIKVHWNDIMLKKRYNPLKAYKQSKLCCMLFAKGFNDRFSRGNIRAYVVDPGLVKTDIGNKQTGFIVNFIWSIRKMSGVMPEIPAKTYAFLCEQEHKLEGLYYCMCREKPFSKQVTTENSDRLFKLSEKLCDMKFDDSGGVS